METRRPTSLILAAFITSVLFGGLNAIGVRYTVMELSPSWGATLRFTPAALLLFLISWALRLPLPKGRSLRGAIYFGLLNFGASYVFLYWGLQRVQPGLAQVIMALVPLLTLFFAIAHGQESFHWRPMLGAILAMGGITVVFGEQLSADVPFTSLMAVVLGSACMAESAVLIKKYPQSHTITTNAIAMLAGAVLLFIMSLLWREPWALPALPATWVALAYLILFGSCVTFILYLFVLKQWTASATAYGFVLLPFVTIAASSWLTGETVTFTYLAGGALVLLGVYIGALASSKKYKRPIASAVSAPSPTAEGD